MPEEKERKEKKARTVDKWKKKQWYQLIASREFDKRLLGETVAEKPTTLVGRTIRVNLGDLSGQRQRRHISIKFRVVGVEGNQASTETVGHEISRSFMNRLTRRRMSKIEFNQVVETIDGKKVKVKSVALSARKLPRAQVTAIRKEMGERIEGSAKKKTLAQLSQEMIFGVLASKLFKQLTKVAPLKRVEVVKSRLLEGK